MAHLLILSFWEGMKWVPILERNEYGVEDTLVTMESVTREIIGDEKSTILVSKADRILFFFPN